jgi:hypothetical protein
MTHTPGPKVTHIIKSGGFEYPMCGKTELLKCLSEMMRDGMTHFEIITLPKTKQYAADKVGI